MKKIIPSLLLTTLLLTGCTLTAKPTTVDTGSPAKIRILATIYPITDMVRQIGGDRVECTTILPPAANPHTFEPTAQQVAQFSRAQLIFKIGLGFEYWSDRLLPARTTSRHIVVLSEGITPLDDPFHHHDDDHAPDHNANPHIWLDPVNAQAMCRHITNALSAYDPSHRADYEKNFVSYEKKLKDLDRKINESLAPLPNKKYVTFHPTWGYFDRRYGTECVGVIELSTGKESTPMNIKNVIDAINRFHISGVFVEPQFNHKIANLIAQQTGTRIILLDSIGNPTSPSTNTYLNLMYSDVAAIMAAFTP